MHSFSAKPLVLYENRTNINLWRLKCKEGIFPFLKSLNDPGVRLGILFSCQKSSPCDKYGLLVFAVRHNRAKSYFAGRQREEGELMKVLITGATGFVGNAIAHRLASKGHQIRCLMRETSDTKSLSDIVWEKVVGDITNMENCREMVRGMEAVIHCAAHVTDFGSWKTFRKINVEGSVNLADASLGNKVDRFIYLSTSDVLGLRTDVPLGDDMPCEKSGFQYPDTKIEAEEALFELFRKRNLPLVALRPTWIYGPGDRTFFPEVIDALAKGLMFYFWDKKTVINLTYIDNLVDAIMMSLENENCIGRAYLVIDDETITWEELCEKLSAELGYKPPKFSLPKVVSAGLAKGMSVAWSAIKSKNRPMITPYNIAFTGATLMFDDSRIKKELGFAPRVGLEEGFARTMEWFKSLPVEKLKIK